LQATKTAHRTTATWLAALVGSLALLLAAPAVGHAEEVNPNQQKCQGSIKAGQPEAGNEETQVAYVFYCNAQITGYQLAAQIPITGVQGQPLVELPLGKPASDSFSCAGEFPGLALNCVGLTKLPSESITGQFSVGTKLCAEPRVDPLLTVTYAYLEKGVVTQAISGPFDLGRPVGCPADKYSGSTRLEPKLNIIKTKHKAKKARKARRASHRRENRRATR